jgi:hypothetical protein
LTPFRGANEGDFSSAGAGLVRSDNVARSGRVFRKMQQLRPNQFHRGYDPNDPPRIEQKYVAVGSCSPRHDACSKLIRTENLLERRRAIAQFLPMKVATVLLSLVCLVTLSGKDKSPPIPVENKIVVLEPIKIQGSPIISFAIDITIYAQPKTRKVDRIFIARVLPDSDAERAGLQKGDEIVKLDGVSVKEYDAIVSIESPLGRVLLNRTPGDPLKMEVIARRPQSFTLRAQRPPLIMP